MRFIGNRQVPSAPALPDTVLSLQLTAASGAAFDYPGTCDIIKVSAGSTFSGLGTVYFNPNSTGAVVPTTAHVISTTAASSQHSIPVVAGGPAIFYQRPRGSTGFSLISGSSHSVCVEFWSRGGSTSST